MENGGWKWMSNADGEWVWGFVPSQQVHLTQPSEVRTTWFGPNAWDSEDLSRSGVHTVHNTLESMKEEAVQREYHLEKLLQQDASHSLVGKKVASYNLHLETASGRLPVVVSVLTSGNLEIVCRSDGAVFSLVESISEIRVDWENKHIQIAYSQHVNASSPTSSLSSISLIGPHVRQLGSLLARTAGLSRESEVPLKAYQSVSHRIQFPDMDHSRANTAATFHKDERLRAPVSGYDSSIIGRMSYFSTNHHNRLLPKQTEIETEWDAIFSDVSSQTLHSRRGCNSRSTTVPNKKVISRAIAVLKAPAVPGLVKVTTKADRSRIPPADAPPPITQLPQKRAPTAQASSKSLKPTRPTSCDDNLNATTTDVLELSSMESSKVTTAGVAQFLPPPSTRTAPPSPATLKTPPAPPPAPKKEAVPPPAPKKKATANPEALFAEIRAGFKLKKTVTVEKNSLPDKEQLAQSKIDPTEHVQVKHLGLSKTALPQPPLAPPTKNTLPKVAPAPEVAPKVTLPPPPPAPPKVMPPPTSIPPPPPPPPR